MDSTFLSMSNMDWPAALLALALDRILKRIPGIPADVHFFVFEPSALQVHLLLLAATTGISVVLRATRRSGSTTKGRSPTVASGASPAAGEMARGQVVRTRVRLLTFCGQREGDAAEARVNGGAERVEVSEAAARTCGEPPSSSRGSTSWSSTSISSSLALWLRNSSQNCVDANIASVR